MTSEQARQLVMLGVALGEVFTPEGVDVWLRGRNKLLDDRQPLDMIAAGEVDDVRRLVEGLAEGVVF